MAHGNRRQFLGLLALGLATEGFSACGRDAQDGKPGIPDAVPGPAYTYARAPAPTRQIALTVDDGFDIDTLSAYVEFARDTGIALNFDPVGRLAHHWEPHVDALRPLIEKGQVQIANHTYNHLLLTQLDDKHITREIERNEDWIEKTFGVTSRPYLRPPSGLRDARTDELAGNLGFTRILMWQGSFGDAQLVTPEKLLANARGALLPGAIVVGHANAPTVTHLYSDLLNIIRERKLRPVTLDAMFGTSRASGS